MKNLKVLGARITANVEELSIADTISATPDEVNKYRARFAPVTAGAIKDYNGEVKWDSAKVVPVELGLTQKKYFAFGVDDVESLLTNPMRIDREAKKQARDISREEDTQLLATLKKEAGKTIQRTIKTPSGAYEAIVDVNKELSKLDAPLEDRFIIISYDILGMLEKDSRFTKYDQILANGMIEGTNINGSMLIVTNALPEDTIIAVQREGVAFARFLDKLETMRLESAFADGIRGLSVFDGKALEKDYVVAVDVKGGTEEAVVSK